MTITWLTPVNNFGRFVFSMNKKRYSCGLLQQGKKFTLNVPIKGMEKLVLGIGGCSGRDCNKIETLAISICKPGWIHFPSTNTDVLSQNEHSKDGESHQYSSTTKQKTKKNCKSKSLPPDQEDSPLYWSIHDCCAHLVCQIISIADADDGHFLFTAEIFKGFVKKSYWNGKNFLPASSNTAPYLVYIKKKIC